VDGYSYQPGKLNEGTIYYWKINDGKVWKFRTEGTPVPVSLNSSLNSNKTLSKPVTFQKGKPGQSMLLIGIQKGDNEKRLYDLKGKEQTHQKRNKITKKAGQ
jgi:hypothetical protein